MGVIIPQPASASEDRAPGGSKSGGSLRFDANNDYAAQSPHLKRTPSTAGNLRTWTISVWMRRSDVQEGFAEWFQAGEWATSPWYHTYFQGPEFHTYILGPSNSPNSDLHSTEHFYDPSGWMHLVLVNDSTQSTNLERHRLYINGERKSHYPDDTTYIPAQNFDGCVNGTAKEHRIGLSGSNSSPYEGYMSDFYMIDGQALEPTDFGYTDVLTNTWMPKKYDGEGTKSPNAVDKIFSANFAASDGFQSAHPAKNAFNGQAGPVDVGRSACSSSGCTLTLSSIGVTVKSKLEIWSGYGSASVNGGTAVNYDSSAPGWQDLSFTGALTSIAITGASGVNAGELYAVRVDGVILTDGGGYGINGCYLPFDGNTPIGKDQSGRGNDWTATHFGGSNTLDKATGAFPILNTTGGGTIAASGVRGQVGIAVTVYNSGSGNKYYLDGLEAPSLTRYRGQIITFDTSDSTLSGHPFKLATKTDGTHGTTDYSVDFDGTGDYLSIGSHADTTLGGTDFTMECWVYFTGTGTDVFFENDTGTGGCSIQINGDNLLSIQIGATNITGTHALATSTWHHLCVQRDHSASMTRAYVNGMKVTQTGTDAGTSTSTVTIGGRSGGSFLTTGKICDARIVKGSMVYDFTTFTPPTSPLTSVTNTKLLCCQSSAVTTATTSSGGAITSNGDPTASNDTPYDHYQLGTASPSISEGTVGSATTITIPHSAPDNLYYYCGNHSGMGGTLQIKTDLQVADPYNWKTVLAAPFNERNPVDVSHLVNPAGSAKKDLQNNGSVETFKKSVFYGASKNFDGSNDYVTVANSNDEMVVGEDEYTIEFWLNTDDNTSAEQTLWYWGDNGSAYWAYGFYQYTSNIKFLSTGSGGSWDSSNMVLTDNIPLDRWTHLAVARDGEGTVRGFVNGQLVATETGKTQDLANNTGGVFGAWSSSQWTAGQMQDIKVTRACKYTDSFIPAQTNPDITKESPYGVAYGSRLLAPTSGSLAIEGNSFDGIYIPDSSDWDLGTNDFTAECWFFISSSAGGGTGTVDANGEMLFGQWDTGGGGNTNNAWLLWLDGSSSNIRVGWYDTNDGSGTANNDLKSAHNAVTQQRWHHVAATRKGNDFTLWLDGKSIVTATNSNSIASGSCTMKIGRWATGDSVFTGLISNVRLVNGTALYTQDFTPSKEPLTTTSQGATAGQVKLLACQSSVYADPAVCPTGTASLNLPLSSTPFADSSSNSYTVTNNGSIATASAGTNDFNITNAASFDGSSQRLNMNSNLTLTGEWTIDAWIKLDSSASGYNAIYNSGYTASNNTYIYIGLDDDEKPYVEGGSAGGRTTATNAINKNQWYHIRASQINQSLGTAHQRIYLYVNGERVVIHGANTTDMSSLGTDTIGSLISDGNNANNFHGLIGPVRHVPVFLGKPPAGGAATSSGALTNTPKAYARAEGVNNIASNPFDVDMGSYQLDPGRYCTWNPTDTINPTDVHFTEGDCRIETPGTTTSATAYGMTRGTVGVDTGRYYFELDSYEEHGSGTALFGVSTLDYKIQQYCGDTGSICYMANNGNIMKDAGSSVAYGSGYSPGDVVGCALDMTHGAVYFSLNGVWQNNSDPTSGDLKIGTVSTSKWTPGDTNFTNMAPAISDYQEGSFKFIKATLNCGQKPFHFAPPNGYKPLTTGNIAPPVIDPNMVVGITTYIGDGTNNRKIRFDRDIEPDLVWYKERSEDRDHQLYDTVRGVGPAKNLCSNTQYAQASNDDTSYGYLSAFNKDGFTVTNGSSGGNENIYTNKNTEDYVAWGWRAGGKKGTWNLNGKDAGSASAAGLTTGDTSVLTGASINTETGFSIVLYTQDSGGAAKNIAHGLTKAPQFVIMKHANATSNWFVNTPYYSAASKLLYLNSDSGEDTSSDFGSAIPGATYNATQTSGVNGRQIILYSWHDVPGIQKFGKYSGNAGVKFLYLGFKPAIFMQKCFSHSADWEIFDLRRDGANNKNDLLYPCYLNAEAGIGGAPIYFLSNGVAWRTGNNHGNGSGRDYIYAAWADTPTFDSYGRQPRAR